MVITTAGTTEKSGTLAKRKKLILHIYALMLALFALRWENNRKNCEEMEVNRLKLLIIFLLRIYLLSKSSAKNSFPSRFPVGNGAKKLHKRKRITGTNIRCNTLQLEIQHVASFGSNAVHLSIQHVAMRDTTRCMPLLNTLSHPFRWQLVLHSSHKDAGCLFSRQK